MKSVKFVVDNNLTPRLATWLKEQGYDVLHPQYDLDKMPDAAQTSDRFISILADKDDRVVISRDNDFKNGHFEKGSPSKLVFVFIYGQELMKKRAFVAHFSKHFPAILELLETFPALELNEEGVIPLTDRTLTND